MFDVFQQYISRQTTITDQEFDLIQSVSTLKKLRKRQFLLQEGDTWQNNAFVCKGCVRTYRIDSKGLEHILNFAIEGWWTGDREALLTGNPAKSTIDVLEDSVILLINKENFEMLCHKIPAFNELVNTILERSFVASQNRIHANISFTAEEKYVNFIKTYPTIYNRVPQHMIASFLGLTPEMLSRVRSKAARK
jgi:CRP-like cAMP-binding protein